MTWVKPPEKHIFNSFYSHASCEAWLRAPFFCCPWWCVSTHMPLARHDEIVLNSNRLVGCFYSHASCEAWHIRFWIIGAIYEFLLTCLLRGMTLLRQTIRRIFRFLLTCLLRGMTCFRWQVQPHLRFYSHASCEAWPRFFVKKLTICCFYSHASCEAWLHTFCHFWMNICFYSHASCEAWRLEFCAGKVIRMFLLTCLLRGMTLYIAVKIPVISFYSHASCEAWPHWLSLLHIRH